MNLTRRLFSLLGGRKYNMKVLGTFDMNYTADSSNPNISGSIVLTNSFSGKGYLFVEYYNNSGSTSIGSYSYDDMAAKGLYWKVGALRESSLTLLSDNYFTIIVNSDEITYSLTGGYGVTTYVNMRGIILEVDE